MPQEVELKLKVRDHKPVRKALRKTQAEYLGTFIETDTFFDTREGKFRRADSAVRLRTVRCVRRGATQADVRPVLTYKGPRRRNTKLKTRQELQTRVDDADALAAVLRSCGLKPVRTIQKRRAVYRLGGCVVTLDTLPLIGCFVEVEGPDTERIVSLAGRLGLQDEHISTSYLELLERACRQRGISPQRVLLNSGR